MPILAAYIVPHPPLIIPEIGRGEQLKIQKTIDAYEKIASEIAQLAPDTVVFITPHSVSYGDYIHISPGLIAEGDFGRFGAKDVFYGVMYEKKLVKDITAVCEARGIRAGNHADAQDGALDHGFMVPLHFIHKYFRDFRCVRVSISGLPFAEHYRLGQVITEVCDNFNRNTVIIASGDLSHRLKSDGPYGFAPEGPVFDKKICDIIERRDFDGFLHFSPRECNSVGECGLRSFIVMAGMLDGKTVEGGLLSYEGTFGVGYAVGRFIVAPDDKSQSYQNNDVGGNPDMYKPESDYTRLAKLTLETYVSEGRIIDVPVDISDELKNNRAGVFVSLKKHGNLRGCIGTIGPVQNNIALEIISNAISSGTKDNRFRPVTADELPELVYSVDVLGESERIVDKSELDAKEYGVIVTNGFRRGLLLPNLEGVDTVDEQIEIALQKAGISPHEDYEMERFRVVRYK